MNLKLSNNEISTITKIELKNSKNITIKKKNKKNNIKKHDFTNSNSINSHIKMRTDKLKVNNNFKNKNKYNNYNDYELNNLSYKNAIKIDKRTYFQYYLSLLKMKHLIIFSFYTYTDYNSNYFIFIFIFFIFNCKCIIF